MIAIRNFKFLGFALGKGKKGYFICAHRDYLKKEKAKLRELTSRSQGRNVRVVMHDVKVYNTPFNFSVISIKACKFLRL
ncbi:hypothetical protein IWB18_10060 [Alkalibacter sp. M17DMB]|nr:hypothetical protein [Alkalibacter mobilis]